MAQTCSDTISHLTLVSWNPLRPEAIAGTVRSAFSVGSPPSSDGNPANRRKTKETFWKRLDSHRMFDFRKLGGGGISGDCGAPFSLRKPSCSEAQKNLCETNPRQLAPLCPRIKLKTFWSAETPVMMYLPSPGNQVMKQKPLRGFKSPTCKCHPW